MVFMLGTSQTAAMSQQGVTAALIPMGVQTRDNNFRELYALVPQ